MNISQGEGNHLEYLMEAYQNGTPFTEEEMEVPWFAQAIRDGDRLLFGDLLSHTGVGSTNCHGMIFMNNTGCFHVFACEITRRTAMKISKMLHEIFQDRAPYKFQDEQVDDKILRGKSTRLLSQEPRLETLHGV